MSSNWNFSKYTERKYKNDKVRYKDLQFDSQRECSRYIQLEMMQRAGEITDLQMQVKYELIPAQYEPDIIGPRGGKKKGKLIEKSCCYFADFVYKDNRTGETVVEDTKGMRTTEYIIKRKLMLWIHGVRIREI